MKKEWVLDSIPQIQVVLQQNKLDCYLIIFGLLNDVNEQFYKILRHRSLSPLPDSDMEICVT